jgi:hypothetical protein
MFPQPDMTTDVNADGAIKCADTALHTAQGFGNNVPAGKHFTSFWIEMIFFVMHDLFPM